MDVFLATSRGKGLEAVFRPSPYRIIPGASLEKLILEAKKILLRLQDPSPKKHHVYFIAGLPDVTTMEREPGYQEVIFMENEEEAEKRLEVKYSKATIDIIVMNAIPIFSTISPCSQEKWNNTRLQKGKTTHLLPFNQYNDMQCILIINRINKTIISINNTSNTYTPRLAKQITYVQGRKRKSPRVR
jgi:hypothetical protein